MPTAAITNQRTSNLQVRITRPDNGTIYRITPQTPLETQRIPVQAIVADNVRWKTMTIARGRSTHRRVHVIARADLVDAATRLAHHHRAE